MRSTVVRAVVFVVVSGFLTVLLAIQLRGTQPTGPEYAALFTDSSGITVGSDVRAAGVTVGRVESIDVRPDNLIEIGFEVQPDMPLTSATTAALRYKNLTGDRYLELSGGAANGSPLPPGGVIPASRTHPALDLDALYNGFAPLFEGLQPDQVNELTGSLVQVLQGQGGSVNTLLAQIGSLTGTLADRDQVIGHLVDNLNGVLATVDAHSGQVDDLVVRLTDLVSGLDKDRGRISHSLTAINDLTDSVTDLLHDVRPDLKGTVHEVDRLSTVLNADRDHVDQLLRNFPGHYTVLGRIGSYSSAFQFYICGLQLWIQDGDGPAVRSPMVMAQGDPRCHF